MKKEFRIILNDGKIARQVYHYSFGNTKGIEIHLHKDKALIVFIQDSKRKPEALLGSKDPLCSDAIKKVMLLHLIVYGTPLEIRTADMAIDNEKSRVYDKKMTGDPLVYSMIERPLDHPLPDPWRREDVLNTILNSTKSSYDGRMNAVMALLLGKAEYYRSQKSMYLWMAMNGLYNYLTEQCKKLPSCKLGFRKEYKQHEYLAAIAGEPYSVECLNDEAKTDLFRDGLSHLKQCQLPPETVFEKPEIVTEGLELSGEINGKQYEISSKMFLSIWLPYQIRCNYFHSDAALPIFAFADEPLLKALIYTNWFVEAFVEEHLPQWLISKELSDEQKRTIREASRALK